jgi:citrate lyase subunit alpha/citrate CoA-transferase
VDIKREVEDMCGGPAARPRLGKKVVAAVKWVDGTVIDAVRQLEK